ncbi:polyhydroxyalkanoate depolymerase [Dokdonella sp.]|uniref:polyhydroxyalkanoate depolymerase n=1 Tax=Dokdonella sp. TaxID=2291710 RepID=UPI0025C7078E|nr:polyhydroxyalkanoate depolymerase [Dokdonella sp.]MBX3688332.1 polyhydroxyalkanoate depolymerase [Dokdonella sp.]
MLYHFHEINRALLNPWVAWSGAVANALTSPDNWTGRMPGVERISAGLELFYRLGKDYEKPAFGITSVHAHDRDAAVIEERALETPFCHLLHFKRYSDDPTTLKKLRADPVVLVVAPLSGHHATLLRDTVRTLLRDHDVYITDWIDARMVPLADGLFGLDDYVALMRRFITHLGADKLHVMSVCQPTVPVLAAVSLMASAGEPTPRSLVLMGGPIDPRKAPTQVNDLATRKPYSWFETNVVFAVPPNYPGSGRRVYPGFLQHAGFVAMNPSRHFSAHWDFYRNLLRGDLDDAEAHRHFYDEYNAVLDMPAQFYLDTIRTVFQEFSLPRGNWHINGERVAPEAIRRTALLTIEGELDDISGIGQTRAAHELCPRISTSRRQHLEIQGAGHYGIFSGRRWRDVVYPEVRAFFRRHAAR